MDTGMLALLGKSTALMDSLGFLWTVQSGLELNLWSELESPKTLDDLMNLHPDWNKVLLDHWLEQAYLQELLGKTDEHYRITKLGKAVNKYKDHGLQALYTEMVRHWSSGFAALPQLIRNEREKLTLSPDMEEEWIAKASLASEPFVWPFLREKCRKEHWHRVLDLGCGEGLYLQKLTSTFPTLYGVGLELNPAVASRAQQRSAGSGERLHILCADILALTEDNSILAAALGKFDVCLLNNSIYYFTPEQRLTVLDGVKKVLVPGGQLGILSAVRKGEPHPLFRTHVPQNLMSFYLSCHQGFQGLPTKQEITGLLRSAGYPEVTVSVMPLNTSHYFFAKCADG